MLLGFSCCFFVRLRQATQDIHRQKIERVINVMRALSRYMSLLFEGRLDDTKRVSSATHIQGDSTENVVNEEDIEALIANFGK